MELLDKYEIDLACIVEDTEFYGAIWYHWATRS